VFLPFWDVRKGSLDGHEKEKKAMVLLIFFSFAPPELATKSGTRLFNGAKGMGLHRVHCACALAIEHCLLRWQCENPSAPSISHANQLF